MFLSLSEVVMVSENICVDVPVCCLHLPLSVFCLQKPALILAMGEQSVTSSVSRVGCGEVMGHLYLVFRLESTKEGVSSLFKTPEA